MERAKCWLPLSPCLYTVQVYWFLISTNEKEAEVSLHESTQDQYCKHLLLSECTLHEVNRTVHGYRSITWNFGTLGGVGGVGSKCLPPHTGIVAVKCQGSSSMHHLSFSEHMLLWGGGGVGSLDVAVVVTFLNCLLGLVPLVHPMLWYCTVVRAWLEIFAWLDQIKLPN